MTPAKKEFLNFQLVERLLPISPIRKILGTLRLVWSPESNEGVTYGEGQNFSEGNLSKFWLMGRSRGNPLSPTARGNPDNN